MDILFSTLSFILGILTATLYQRFARPWSTRRGDPLGDRRAVAGEALDAALEEAESLIADLRADDAGRQAENARLQAELDELRRRLDALGRVDWSG